MATKQETINRLAEYVEKHFSRNSVNSIIIKPKGAFKECEQFYADFTRNIKHEKISYIMEIMVDDIYDNENNCCHVVIHRSTDNESDNLNTALVKCIEKLDEMEFNKALGLFYPKRFTGIPDPMEFEVLMNDLWGLDKDLNCCVCGDPTRTETPCGHRLCLICWSKNNKDKKEKQKVCPMCRADIRFRDKDSESDED
jgi:hypothetical protein